MSYCLLQGGRLDGQHWLYLPELQDRLYLNQSLWERAKPKPDYSPETPLYARVDSLHRSRGNAIASRAN